jgi:type IV pilus assembly protein PilM
MTRLHAEIARSVSFYRSQQAGAQPARVFLAGGTSSMPYMREFFQEKFQMPVEFFNPLRNVAVGGQLGVDDVVHRAHSLGGLVGLALRSGSSCPMELNLRPASVIRRQRQARQRPAYILAALCLLAGLATWWMYYDRSADATQEFVTGIEPKVNQLKDYEGRLTKVRNEIKTQEDLAQPLLLAVRERDYWVRVINDINSRLPPEFVWITSLVPDTRAAGAGNKGGGAGGPGGPGGNAGPGPGNPPGGARAGRGGGAAGGPETVILISGLYLTNDKGVAVVDDFITRLSESELYTVDKASMERQTPTETEWAFPYSFPLVLKNPIPLGAGYSKKGR